VASEGVVTKLSKKKENEIFKYSKKKLKSEINQKQRKK